MSAVMKLALLLCDTPVPAVLSRHGTYVEIFKTLLAASHPASAFTLDGFDVVKDMSYPDPDAGYHGILISGSAASAYEDLPWINKLVAFVAETSQKQPHIKLIGICFGHQVIARAFGGSCVPNNGRWEVGVTEIELTELGKNVFGTDNPTISVQQMHRDHVPTVPPAFRLLGSSPVAPVQGLVLPYPSDSAAPATALTSPTNIHIFTVQGHPEFTSDIVLDIIDTRERSGAMQPDVVVEGRERAVRSHDGTGLIGRAIWRVLGVA